jgi:GT2 family glycosyltransferase
VTASISVVVCAYSLERWRDLVEAVASLQRQSVQPAQTIVVIDHNVGLLARARTSLPGVTIVPNRHRRGLSGARNSGIEAASGEIVAFLDDDAVAASDWLERLGKGYADPRVQGVGGTVVPRWAGGRRPRWFPAEFDWVVGCSYVGQPAALAPVRNLIGANMSYRRQALAAAGGFREGIGRVGRTPLGCEETELSIRVLERSPEHRVLYDPAARVEHRVPRSRQRVRYFLARCYAEGLSKALVTRLVGARSGLSSERAYTFRILPRGALAGTAAGRRGDLAGFGRTAAIVTGLAATTLGYVAGRLRCGAGVGAAGVAPAPRRILVAERHRAETS